MLIECSFCHATAKISEDKEGAKVRCSECGKVYVAREKGSRAKKAGSGMSPTTIGIGAGAIVVILIFAVMASRSKPAPPPAPPPVVQAPVEVVDHSGWNSEIVKVVRGVYDSALAQNTNALTAALDGPRIAQRLTEQDPANPVDFAAFGPVERQTFIDGIAEQLSRGTDENSPHLWKPFEGGILTFDLLDVVVRISADKRQEGAAAGIAETRKFDWHLTRPTAEAKWRVWSWERFISEEERRALKANKPKVTRVTTADGGSLFQAEMRRLDPYPGTPPEQVVQIEKLIATMTDLTLRPKDANLARDEVVAIGRPAIPLLLNKFFEIQIVEDADHPSLTQLAIVDSTLQRITGYESSFTPLPGQTEERRTMALKAWFAWWERKGQNFTAPKVQKDLLEDLIVPTERDKREIEKAKGGGL